VARQECSVHEKYVSACRSWRDGATRRDFNSPAVFLKHGRRGSVSNEGLRQFRRRGHPGAGWQGCEIIARRSMRRIAIPTVRGLAGWRDAILRILGCFPGGDTLRTGVRAGSFPRPQRPNRESRRRCPPTAGEVVRELIGVARRTWLQTPASSRQDILSADQAGRLRVPTQHWLRSLSGVQMRPDLHDSSFRSLAGGGGESVILPRSKSSAIPALPLLRAPLRESETARAVPGATPFGWFYPGLQVVAERTRRHDR